MVDEKKYYMIKVFDSITLYISGYRQYFNCYLCKRGEIAGCGKSYAEQSFCTD
jgi:hypothetical protein